MIREHELITMLTDTTYPDEDMPVIKHPGGTWHFLPVSCTLMECDHDQITDAIGNAHIGACVRISKSDKNVYKKMPSGDWSSVTINAMTQDARTLRIKDAGLAERKIVAHPDDFNAVRAFARSLYKKRGIEI